MNTTQANNAARTIDAKGGPESLADYARLRQSAAQHVCKQGYTPTQVTALLGLTSGEADSLEAWYRDWVFGDEAYKAFFA